MFSDSFHIYVGNTPQNVYLMLKQMFEHVRPPCMYKSKCTAIPTHNGNHTGRSCRGGGSTLVLVRQNIVDALLDSKMD